MVGDWWVGREGVALARELGLPLFWVLIRGAAPLPSPPLPSHSPGLMSVRVSHSFKKKVPTFRYFSIHQCHLNENYTCTKVSLVSLYVSFDKLPTVFHLHCSAHRLNNSTAFSRWKIHQSFFDDRNEILIFEDLFHPSGVNIPWKFHRRMCHLRFPAKYAVIVFSGTTTKR